MAMDRFLTSNGYTDRAGYVRYLRECAHRWRNSPVTGVSAEWRERQRSGNEEQARRIEAKADRIERGEDS